MCMGLRIHAGACVSACLVPVSSRSRTRLAKLVAPVQVLGYAEEELAVNGLRSLQSVALRLNKKLELTSVKRLMRLGKYKSFSPEELSHVSNGHIISVIEQVRLVRDKLGEWELGQAVFRIVENSAELCLKVNDYAEAINRATYKKLSGASG